ncbi:MAG: class F sortase [bacterium]|nr:class F sortase [bacterium]
MSKTVTKKKPNKRQPKKLPLSSRQEKLTKTKILTKNSKSRKTAIKKTTQTNTKGNSKKPKPNKKGSELSLWLGRSRRLQIKIGIVQAKPTKPKKSRAKTHSPTKNNRSNSRFLSIIYVMFGLSGTAYFLLNLQKPLPPPPVYSPPVPQIVEIPPEQPETSLPKSEPLSLRIPDAGISTQLLTVGIRKDGAMEVPRSFTEAGWYRHSPTPGEIGPAVIVGHVDSVDGPAVFWRLSQLQPGQIVEIERTDKKIVKFKITDIKQYDQKQFPSADVYGNIDYAGLRLITCGGSFNKVSQRYSHNTVVYATMII